MRLPYIALVVALAIAAFQLAYFYPQLPAVMASHFNAAGIANSWQPKAAFAATICFVLILFAAIPLLMPQIVLSAPPQVINLPNKAYWLAPERRPLTAHLLGDQMAWLGTGQIIFITLICQLAINANLPGGSGRLGFAAIWIVAFAVVFFGFWTIRFYRMFARASG